MCAAALLVSVLLAGCGDDADDDANVALCGNGKLDQGERCDKAIAEGAVQCPASCSGEDACAPKLLVGQDCQVQCMAMPITRAVDADGCYPGGAGPETDVDCGTCRDGIIVANETCDPPDSCPKPAECPAPRACLTRVLRKCRGVHRALPVHCAYGMPRRRRLLSGGLQHD
jgi:hypothetical protein